MMKFIIMILFMNFMMIWNSMVMFFYNLLFLLSFFMIMMFMFKELSWMSVSMMFGIEYYSIWLVILSIWIVGLMFMCLEDDMKSKYVVFLFLLTLLVMFFSLMDLILFYMVFEVSLIPTFMLIVYWGVNPERLSAAYYLLMYMLMISFPLLVLLFWIYMYSLTFKFNLLEMVLEMYMLSMGGYLLMFLPFYIKLPIYFFHIWLPKAHVEAPVYGSMILAGVLLKMGGYGLLRLMKLFVKSSLMYSYMILSVGVIGSMLMSVVCLVQVDMKSLVAYSSVVHMNMMLCALMTLFKLGVVSSYIMMLSHGLCSSGLFYMVNMYYYRTKSRLLVLNKGLMGSLMSLMLWWFILCAMNMSFPFSLNFISEVFMIMVILNWDLSMLLYLALVCFLAGAYSLYLFSYIQHGSGNSFQMFFFSFVKEYMVLVIHVYPLFFFLLNLLVFM